MPRSKAQEIGNLLSSQCRKAAISHAHYKAFCEQAQIRLGYEHILSNPRLLWDRPLYQQHHSERGPVKQHQRLTD